MVLWYKVKCFYIEAILLWWLNWLKTAAPACIAKTTSDKDYALKVQYSSTAESKQIWSLHGNHLH